MKAFVKNIYRIVNDEDVVLGPDLLHAKIDVSLGYLVREAEKQRGNIAIEKEALRFYKVVLFYAILVLCSGIEMENQAAEKYWGTLEKPTVQERIEHIIYKIPQIIWRGPFVLMAYMTLSQVDQKFSRGLWFDCLHSVYITYVDRFFTCDQHFITLRERLPDVRLKSRIVHMAESQVVYTKKDWLGQE